MESPERAEKDPQTLRITDLKEGKTYIAAEKIEIFIAKDYEKSNYGELFIESGSSFTIEHKSWPDMTILLANGVTIRLTKNYFPEKAFAVYEKEE